MTNYLNEAFQRLSLLEDDFPLSENDAIKRLQEYMADDIEMPEEEVIIDPEAEDENDLQDSYIGKVILECGACHTRVYNDEEDVVIDEETGMANVGDECPVCGATTGWNVIGKIESYDADRDVEAEAEKIEDGEEEEIEEPEEPSDEPVDDDIDVEEEAEEEVEESLDEALEDDDVCPECGNNPCTCMDKKHKKIKEAKNSDVLKKKLKGLKEKADCDEDLKEELEQSDLQASDELAVEDDKRLEDPNDDPVEEDPQVLEEGIENLSLDTEDTHMEMTSDENGKVTVSTEPLGASEEPMEGEMIAPLDSEEQAEIEANEPEVEVGEDEFSLEEPVEGEEPVEDESEFDEFDEESFDEMGESYMRKVYENVDSFKTTNVSEHNDQLIVEGVIKFSSGKEKNTKFIFENAKQTKRGKIVLEGINSTFSNTKKSFILKGSVNNKKYISESMIYSYKTKQLNESNESEVIKVHGRVKRK